VPLRWTSLALLLAVAAAAEPRPAAPADSAALRPFLDRHCVECHGRDDRMAGLDLDSLAVDPIDRNPEIWEKVVRKLRARQMPPRGADRPIEADYDAALSRLVKSLDAAAGARPDPGRTATFRRLTRTEYRNAIRDLLDLEIDATALLPGDEAGHGFDNVTVGDLSPTLLDRYITAAQKVSRLAVGAARRSPDGDTFRLRGDLTQEGHVEGLPFGTRGGALVPYTFPQDGDYDVQVRLTRDRNEEVEGLKEPHDLEILLDGERVASFTLIPPRQAADHQTADANLKARLPVTAGPHKLGVTFVRNGASLLETKRQPYQAHFNLHRHPRLTPAVYQVSITGPYDAKGPGDTPSRRRIFVARPPAPRDEEDCARRIVAALARRAYRRPVADEDLAKPLDLYRAARAEGDFDAGIEAALGAVLVSPHFLFRIEQDPPGVAPGAAYRVSGLELASRLSFFLWSSIPDDELLDAAERGELRDPAALERQVRRMLADPRSRSLATNFAGQWLHLRNLDSFSPDLRLFPDFDDNLRQAFRRETELLFESVLREDGSVLDLLKTGSTYLDERLAKHYGVPHVYGSRFRQVALDEDAMRGGLLRQGSILTVTSYATRTSPVVRGKWVLENLLGTPPPPPPANIPALKDKTVSADLSVRARLAEHRADAACAACHDLIDPPGFALENFDSVGRWRVSEEGRPVDATGGLPDGSEFVGVAGLEQAVLKRPELFVGTLTEKLMTFAFGRGIGPSDAPAVREVLRRAEADGYRLSSVIQGIVSSTPFQMRRSE
jgi:hypothetical protein